MKENKYYTNSAAETEQLGAEFAKELKPGSIVALYGDLGSGKTTFTKGLAKGLGIQNRIISPTFVLMRDYDLPTFDNAMLHHLDLYRLETAHDLKSLNLNELVNQEKSIYIIEWAEKADQAQLNHAIKISFLPISETQRQIIITQP